ncbi:MAG: hypothetical protein C7N36_12340 [Bacteroidetes bacterium]|nr:MAG: hypothetical protein C7N36_12340 [Bacteroidota bacterium]
MYRLNLAQREAWEAWEASKPPTPSPLEIGEDTITQYDPNHNTGNPRFLEIYGKFSLEKLRLLGVNRTTGETGERLTRDTDLSGVPDADLRSAVELLAKIRSQSNFKLPVKVDQQDI